MFYLVILLKTRSGKKCPGWLQTALLKKTTFLLMFKMWERSWMPYRISLNAKASGDVSPVCENLPLDKAGFESSISKVQKQTLRSWGNFSASVLRKWCNDVRWSLLVNLSCLLITNGTWHFSLCWLAICVFYVVQYLVMHVTHSVNWFLCMCIHVLIHIYWLHWRFGPWACCPCKEKEGKRKEGKRGEEGKRKMAI